MKIELVVGGWMVRGWCNESYYSNYYTFKVIPLLILSHSTIEGFQSNLVQ